MEEEEAVKAPALRLVNFISEEQLDEAKKSRGERVEDGTAQRDKPLFEILKANKDKKDAEFNERFKHRPPKALDEDETEFLDKLEESKREYEKQVANKEAEELRSFQEALNARASHVHELKETPIPVLPKQNKSNENKPVIKRPLNVIISVKTQPKKAKTDDSSKLEKVEGPLSKNASEEKNTALGALVSYSDDSDDET
ncbi:hypothetical protein LUZ60_011533 [Juncus effusus]|nr:hypothetical protein LUZ60_011533 [Juncus effusus]